MDKRKSKLAYCLLLLGVFSFIHYKQKERIMANSNSTTNNAMITPMEMDRDYGRLILHAAHSVGLDYDLCLDVKQEVMFDFFTRRLGRYNPELGKLSSFLWTASHNKALDIKQKLRDGKLVIVEEKDLLTTCDMVHGMTTTSRLSGEDAKLFLCEALRRLYRGGVSEKSMRIFAMYVIMKMERGTVAELTGEHVDYVSLVKTRLYGKFLHHLQNIEREDLDGSLKLTEKSIDFLRPVLPFV